MASPGRKALLCAQAPAVLTGIDFVHVDPADHRILAVYFVVEPDALTRPVDTTATELTATITGQEDGTRIAVAGHAWVVRSDATGATRLTLTVTAQEEGDFQEYLLALTDTPADAGPSRLDPFCSELGFRFKQPCPSPFDCAPDAGCPEELPPDYPVDYLARDFESLRNALMAFASDRYPRWEVQTPADFGAMMAELFAAQGDEFAFMQDRVRREGALETLSERRSFQRHARLIDQDLDPGQAAMGLVVMRRYEGTTRPAGLLPDLEVVPPGVRLWADQEDRAPVPFEVGETLEQIIDGAPGYPVHTHWTDLPAYRPDPDAPCLPVGARELVLADNGLLADDFPPEVLGTDVAGYWAGRQVLIETRPDRPDAPVRRVIVTLEGVEEFDDPLTGAGPLLRLRWGEADALGFELDLTRTFVSANLVPVRAGLTRTERFAVGRQEAQDLGLPPTIERQGPADAEGARAVIHRFALMDSAQEGLGWRDRIDAAGVRTHRPDALMEQIDPDLGDALIARWTLGTRALDLGPQDEAAVIEAGLYAPVAHFRQGGRTLEHRDYIGDPGYSLRFGFGEFGRAPTRGDVFDLHWRSGPGSAANLAPDRLTRTNPPAGTPPGPTLPASIRSVRNPLLLTGGRDPESLSLARRIAPAAYRAVTFRAVRDEDYRAQAERLEWVQQAGAITRWTGAWATTFVSADPLGAFTIDEERFAELEARMDAVRQVGRPVIVRQPRFQPLDLRIAICVRAGFAFGAVAEAVIAALEPPRGFFGPDRFTFGQPLRRPDLEAAVAAVEGVRAVLAIAIRERGRTGFHLFDTPTLEVAADRILRVENDPNRAGQGSIALFERSLPQAEEMPA